MMGLIFLILLIAGVGAWRWYLSKEPGLPPAAFEDTRELAIALSEYRNQERAPDGDPLAIEVTFHDDPQLWRQLSEGAEP